MVDFYFIKDDNMIHATQLINKKSTFSFIAVFSLLLCSEIWKKKQEVDHALSEVQEAKVNLENGSVEYLIGITKLMKARKNLSDKLNELEAEKLKEDK